MILTWLANTEHKGVRLDYILRREYGLSRRQIIRLKQRPGSVLINGLPVLITTFLKPGDSVHISMVEHLPPLPPDPIPLDIIFEDQDIIIINKPAGLVSHPTRGYSRGTLANALSHYWQQKGEQRPARLVTRLDKDTSGLVLAAKTAWSHYRLSKTEIHKVYYALTRGIPAPPQGEIALAIGRGWDNPLKRGPNPQGKPAVTRYTTVLKGNNVALVKLIPLTGRTHQLRIHMASIGCPLVDDYMYGCEEGIVGRTALHASAVVFCHPRGAEMQFSVALPQDIQHAVDRVVKG